jgi:hypothetical protein
VKITSPLSETRFALGVSSSDARARTRTTRHRALDAGTRPTRPPREIFSDATGADVGDAIADMFVTRAMRLHALLADAIRGARTLEDARAGRRARSPREEVRGFFPSVSADAKTGRSRIPRPRARRDARFDDALAAMPREERRSRARSMLEEGRRRRDAHGARLAVPTALRAAALLHAWRF